MIGDYDAQPPQINLAVQSPSTDNEQVMNELTEKLEQITENSLDIGLIQTLNQYFIKYVFDDSWLCYLSRLFRFYDPSICQDTKYLTEVSKLISTIVDGNPGKVVPFLIDNQFHELIWRFFPEIRSLRILESLIKYDKQISDEISRETIVVPFLKSKGLIRILIEMLSTSLKPSRMMATVRCISSLGYYPEEFSYTSPILPVIISILFESPIKVQQRIIFTLSIFAKFSNEAFQSICSNEQFTSFLFSCGPELASQRLDFFANALYFKDSADSDLLCRIVENVSSSIRDGAECNFFEGIEVIRSILEMDPNLAGKCIESEIHSVILSSIGSNFSFKTKSSALEALCAIICKADPETALATAVGGFVDFALDFFESNWLQSGREIVLALTRIVSACSELGNNEVIGKIYGDEAMMKVLSEYSQGHRPKAADDEESLQFIVANFISKAFK